MSHKSAMNMVLAQWMPVDPTGSQPTYYRSKRTVQTSSRLKSFQSCVASEMEGETYSDRAAVREAFKKAAQGC